jgi:hypothetical protein
MQRAQLKFTLKDYLIPSPYCAGHKFLLPRHKIKGSPPFELTLASPSSVGAYGQQP